MPIIVPSPPIWIPPSPAIVRPADPKLAMPGLFGGIMTASHALTGTWTTIVSPNVNTTPGGDPWSGYTVRNVIADALLSASGGTKIRITLKAGTAGVTVSKVYVGNHPGTGDAYDTTAQTQILFGGSASTGAISANATKLSDEIAFTRTAGRDLVITIYSATVATNGYASLAPTTNYKTYYKNGDDAATANATGYSNYSTSVGIFMVNQIELFV